MVSNFLRWISFAIVTAALFASSPGAAQPYPDPNDPSALLVPPAYLFRFRIHPYNLGYMLTPIYSEGISHGYSFERSITSIYPIIPGFEPDPSSMLVPLHQWTVIEHGRAYAAYSTYYTTTGSNYHYDGIRGYIIHQNGAGYPIGIYYSQSKGYFYGAGTGSYPDPPIQGVGYVFHGILGRGSLALLGSPGQFPSHCPTNDFCYRAPEHFLVGDVVRYNPLPPPPPPPTCDPQEESDCWYFGGSWDPNDCACHFYYGCDPQEEQACYGNGGSWSNCQCFYY